ncbi:ankyrin repeat domain-containing protein 49-like isoform X2 [Ostrea edulis]|nr:ankyrin repeat domain-containing protein 49-like isoform X2 [Ostrea edulis]
MIARLNNPGMFQSFWEMDEQGVDEESEEEIQKDPKKKILWAAENNYMDIAESLLNEDPSLVNSRDSDLYTPLHRACYNGHKDMVKFLLSHNADIAAQTEDGWFPIHSAARWNQNQVISVLLEQGADINSRTNSGQTPLHLAASEKENGEAIALLLSNCYLDTNIRNSVGETAEDVCSRTSEHCKLFEERRKQQPRLMGNIDHQEGSLGNMDHSNGSGADQQDTDFDCSNLAEAPIAKDHSGDILNLSDNVAQGFEDLSVSMDTNDNEKASDQPGTCHYPNHHAMDENS